MIYREQLESIVSQGCTMPGCDHKKHETLFFHSRCHTQRGVEISYAKGSGVLKISCAYCHQEVVSIAVAESSQAISA